MKIISIVSIIENNKIKEIHSFNDVDDAQRFFAKEISDRGIIPSDVHFGDGFFEFEYGETVCLSQDVVVS